MTVLPLENFAAQTDNARKGRRSAMCNKLSSAANTMSGEVLQKACDELQSLLQNQDDIDQSPDWMVHEPTGSKTIVRDEVSHPSRDP